VTDDKEPPRPVTIRPRATNDIARYAEYLEENASSSVALRFRAAVMKAVDQIEAMPGAGAPRRTNNPRLAGLRMWIVPGFKNYLLFYLTPDGRADIVRLLHAARDVTTVLETEE